MSPISFVSSLFSTVYCDAPAEESKVEEPEAEETPEAPEEVAEEAAEEEEEPEPEDVTMPPMLSSLDADRPGLFSCTQRFERNARTVLNALLIRSTICIVKKRLIMVKVSREKIVSKSCKLFSVHNTRLAADVLLLQM